MILLALVHGGVHQNTHYAFTVIFIVATALEIWAFCLISKLRFRNFYNTIITFLLAVIFMIGVMFFIM